MVVNKNRKSSWPKQAAIVVSESPNVHMLLRELLRSYSWTVIDSTPSVERAVATVRQGLAFIVIVDDTATEPVVNQLRYLLSDPVTASTPTLAFMLDDNKDELPAIQKLGRPVIVDKPLTPSKFVPGFVDLVRRWEQEPYLSLRKANYMFLTGNHAGGFRALLALQKQDGVMHMAAQSVAMHLRRIGKIKEAETILLAALKRSPRDLGTMICLGDLYLSASMPRLAHRLFAGARNSYSSSLAVFPDLVQASLMMNDVDEAIRHLYTMHRENYLTDTTTMFLSRLLFAEGRISEAEKILNNNKTAFSKIELGWQEAESQPLNQAG